eukprot:2162871-Rhodomonas_salina.1
MCSGFAQEGCVRERESEGESGGAGVKRESEGEQRRASVRAEKGERETEGEREGRRERGVRDKAEVVDEGEGVEGSGDGGRRPRELLSPEAPPVTPYPLTYQLHPLPSTDAGRGSRGSGSRVSGVGSRHLGEAVHVDHPLSLRLVPHALHTHPEVSLGSTALRLGSRVQRFVQQTHRQLRVLAVPAEASKGLGLGDNGLYFRFESWDCGGLGPRVLNLEGGSDDGDKHCVVQHLSLIHISEPTRPRLI